MFKLFSSNDIGLLLNEMRTNYRKGVDASVAATAQGKKSHEIVWNALFGGKEGRTAIIVPDKRVGEWISHELAKQDGVALGVPIQYLENWIWNALTGPFRDEKETYALLKPEILQQWLIAEIDEIFAKPEEVEEEFMPLRQYLYAKNPGEAGRKKWESKGSVIRVRLAAHLANYFLEYELNRPTVEANRSVGNAKKSGFGETWLKGDDYFSKGSPFPADKDTEKWQRSLYRRIFKKEAGHCVTEKDGIRIDWVTLPALAKIRRKKRQFEKCRRSGTTFLFSNSGLSHAHRGLVLDLAQNLEIYQVNPCAEFWEDVENSKKKSRPRLLSGAEFEASELPCDYMHKDNSLLELWGQSTKESFALWCQENEYDPSFLEKESVSDKNASRLQRVKSRLERRVSDEQIESVPADASIRIFKAPTRLREVERMREEIVDLIKKGYTEDDILVLVPDLDAYRPLIHLVFPTPFSRMDAKARNVPRRQLTACIEADEVARSRFLVAVRHLFGLFRAGARLGRTEFCLLMRCKFVRDALGLSDEDEEAWERWIGSLNIFGPFGGKEGWNDRFSWNWGFRRLLLDECTGKPWNPGIDDFDSIHPFSDIDTTDNELLAKLMATVEELRQDMERLSGKKKIRDFVAESEAVLEKWIKVPSGDDEKKYSDEELLHQQCIGILREFGHQADFIENRVCDSDEFVEQFLLALNRLKDPKGGFRVGSVQFVSPKSGSIIPHKAVFWLGLDGGAFPGIDDDGHLNLLHVHRIVGDMSPKNQRRSSFLESILAAEERLQLYWLGENAQKQEALSPSSTLLEFQGYLAHVFGLADDDELTTGVCIPLNSEGAGDAVRRPAGVIKKQREEKSACIQAQDIVAWLKNSRRCYLRRELGLKDDEKKNVVTSRFEPLTRDALENWSYVDACAKEYWNRFKRNDPSAVSVAQIIKERFDAEGNGNPVEFGDTKNVFKEMGITEPNLEKTTPEFLKFIETIKNDELAGHSYAGPKACQLGTEYFVATDFPEIYEIGDVVWFVLCSGAEFVVATRKNRKKGEERIGLNAVSKWLPAFVAILVLRAAGESREMRLAIVNPAKAVISVREAQYFRVSSEYDSARAKALLRKICEAHPSGKRPNSAQFSLDLMRKIREKGLRPEYLQSWYAEPSHGDTRDFSEQIMGDWNYEDKDNWHALKEMIELWDGILDDFDKFFVKKEEPNVQTKPGKRGKK